MNRMKKQFIIYLIFFISQNLIAKEILTPIPENIKFNKKKALLGKKLFQDPILSLNKTLSCESCHQLSNGGDDNSKFSTGINNQIGNINSPTVFNAFFNIAQFWDGRAKDLKEQAKGPIENPIEMGNKFPILIQRLKKDENYTKYFNYIYEDGITKDNIADAIAEFEKALITPNSKFDNYLRDRENSLSKEELAGYELFKNYGCISCHNGVNLGGNFFQKFGVIYPYIDNSNLGRYSVTKNDEDKYYFKVPTLRNIALTSPYFHDGSQKDLKIVIKIMGHYQLGRDLNDKDINLLYKFLLTLTGQKPKILND